uniref:Right handed beta helix domain-containing protein n=1 Tax=Anopheles dirus TaxID=7168 RepID=A0A182N2D4_9DIPT
MESCQWSTAVAWILILTTATIRQCTASGGVVSVCAELCTCTNQNFATVNCAFDSSTTNQTDAGRPQGVTTRFVLDGKLFIPSSATALNIKLIAGGQLAIYKDFFKQTNINHLFIDGSKSRTGVSDTAVEFHEGALCNNNGAFPEILIKNVGRLVMHRNVSCGAHLLNITDVKDVVLKTGFLSVDGAEICINNVNNLQIDSNAFGSFATSKLGVSFRLLSFRECNISVIMSDAFQANEIGHIEFINCRLTSLRQKAFSYMLLSDTVIFRGCYIHRIESQFMDGTGINELLLQSNTIVEIASGAFTVTSINTTVIDNHVIRTGKEWLHAITWENVTISGNSFGEFNSIVLEKENKRDGKTVHCYFGNNTITKALSNCFTFGQFCQIDAVHFGEVCECSFDDWLQKLFGNARSESSTKAILSSASCKVEESLRYCFNRSEAPPNDTIASTASQVNVQYFLSEFCKKGGSKKCSSYASAEEAHRKPPPLIPVEKIDSLDESNEGGFLMDNILWISIAAVCVIAILLLSFTACIYRRRMHSTRETITNQSASRQGTVMLYQHQAHARHPFSTADRRVIGSALAWIRESYDQKVWSEIDSPMQQLLAPSQSAGFVEEQVRVRLIGSILESLKRHEICGERIVALNDILFRQLGPPAPELVEAVQPGADPYDELGHIYDELQLNRMRTLGGTVAATAATQHVGLLGEYAAPLDHGAVTVVPEGIYSEPVLHDQRNAGNRNLISPYAIGDATVPRNSAGLATGNLPDVILLRPGTNTWKPGNNDEDIDDDDEDDGGDGEAERKTMLRPADCVDGSDTGPTYAISMKQLKRPHRGNTTPPPTPADAGGDEQPDGTDGNRSEHSGSSMQTVRIEDMTVADGSSDQRLDIDPFGATTVATDILIVNCAQLLVPAGTFRAIRSGFLPRTVRFVDIEQLTLESFAFESGSQTMGQITNPHDPHPILGPITLSFERCQLEEIPANVFHGAALRSVLFSATTIGAVRSLAIGSRFQEFLLSDTVIGHFARHSFKRAQMELLQLHNVTMTGAWASQAWQGLIVRIRISNETAWNVQPDILLERNLIDTFVVTSTASSFLVFPRNFSVHLQAFRIAQLATCDSTNVTFAAWQEIFFLQPFATTSRDDPDSYISVERFRYQEGCDAGGPDMALVIALATLLGVTILAAIIGGLLCWRHYRKRQRMLVLEQKLVQPVPRTYRETQILLKLETVASTEMGKFVLQCNKGASCRRGTFHDGILRVNMLGRWQLIGVFVANHQTLEAVRLLLRSQTVRFRIGTASTMPPPAGNSISFPFAADIPTPPLPPPLPVPPPAPPLPPAPPPEPIIPPTVASDAESISYGSYDDPGGIPAPGEPLLPRSVSSRPFGSTLPIVRRVRSIVVAAACEEITPTSPVEPTSRCSSIGVMLCSESMATPPPPPTTPPAPTLPMMPFAPPIPTTPDDADEEGVEDVSDEEGARMPDEAEVQRASSCATVSSSRQRPTIALATSSAKSRACVRQLPNSRTPATFVLPCANPPAPPAAVQ